MRLKNTVLLQLDEATASFMSRLAFANGIPTITDFLMDAELTMAGFLKGDPRVFRKVSDLSGVAVCDLLRQACVPNGSSRYHLLGHDLGKQHLLRGESRVCPACLRDDTGMQVTPEAMVMAYGRTLWMMASARVCPVHKLALVSPPEDAAKHEFLDAWLPWMFEVMEGDLDQDIAAGGLFEDHLVRRLRGEHPAGWASSFPLGALGAICEMLGVSRAHGKTATLGRLSQTELAIATSAGFELLNDGPSEVLAYFEGVRVDPGKPQDRPQARYGRIYDWLKRGAGSGPEFEPLRGLLRQHILESWPLGAGDYALDYVLPVRRLHSVRTAAKTHDLHPKRLRRILIDAGIIPESDLADFEVTFDVGEARDVLEQASGSVTFTAAQKRLGLTRGQMETLIKAEILIPGEGGDLARPRFTEATIRTWLELFGSFPETQKWETLTGIADAVRKHGVATDQILKLILDGRVTKVFRLKGQNTFSAILIDKLEIAVLLRDNEATGAVTLVTGLPPVFDGVEAVCFDAFGTLVEITDPHQAFMPLFRALRPEKRRELKHRLMRENVSAPDWPEILGVEDRPALPLEVEAKIIAECTSIVLRGCIMEIWTRLRAEGLQLAVCSNLASGYGPTVRHRLPDRPDVEVFSYEAGFIKPEPAIYALVLERLQLEPGRVLFVGDTLHTDIGGPRAAGMKALHIDELVAAMSGRLLSP